MKPFAGATTFLTMFRASKFGSSCRRPPDFVLAGGHECHTRGRQQEPHRLAGQQPLF